MDMDLIVKKVGITCYLLGDYDTFDLVRSRIACRRPTYMEEAIISTVTKQAIKKITQLH
jgi:hypothetical protein